MLRLAGATDWALFGWIYLCGSLVQCSRGEALLNVRSCHGISATVTIGKAAHDGEMLSRLSGMDWKWTERYWCVQLFLVTAWDCDIYTWAWASAFETQHSVEVFFGKFAFDCEMLEAELRYLFAQIFGWVQQEFKASKRGLLSWSVRDNADEDISGAEASADECYTMSWCLDEH